MLLLIFTSGGAGGFSADYGLATETDTAFAPGMLIARPYGLASETDTALEPGGTRLSATAAEVIASFPSSARVSAAAVEVVAVYASTAYVSALAVEVVRSIATGGGRRRQVLPGSF